MGHTRSPIRFGVTVRSTNSNYDWRYPVGLPSVSVSGLGVAVSTAAPSASAVVIPSAPVLGTVSTLSGTVREVNITSYPTVATGLIVEVSLNGAAFVNTGLTVPPGSTFFDYDTGAATSAAFRARAFNASGTSGNSNTVNWTNATVADGQTIIVNGTFATNPATLEWAGGPAGWIESGTVGTAVLTSPRVNWSEEFGNTAHLATFFDSTRAYSGTKSMLADGVDGRHGLIYDAGISTRELLIDYLFYFDNNGHALGSAQVKFLRLVAFPLASNGSFVVDNAGSNFYVRRYADAELGINTAAAGGTHVGPDTGDYPLASPGWYRMRIHYKAPSALGVADAEFRIRINRASDNALIMSLTKTNWLILGATDTHFRYVVFQNYQGNGYELAPNSNMWMDDLAIVKGGKAHLRIGNAPTYAACTQFEFGPWAAGGWSTAQIQGIVNKGGFANLSGKYWYEMSDIDTPRNVNGILVA